MTERSFHKQSFTKRFATMGDPAEAAFDLVYPKNHKLGLNRPPFFMGGMPLTMRYTPDRMTRVRITECMGVGRDRKLKIKVEKVEALLAWQHIGPVWLFVWDSHKKRYYDAPIEDWVDNLLTHGIARTFDNDGKAFTELDVSHFPTEPLELPQEHAEAA